MSEISNRRKLAVGIFISIGLAILIIGVLTIGGQRKAFVKTITLQVIFDDVQGLQAGNNIWLSGMKVGTVKRVTFYGSSQVEVFLNIEKQAQAHIRKDAKARISTDGLVGNKIVVLSGGTEGAPPVENNDRLASERLAGMQEMMSTLQASNGNILEITGNLKAISEKLKMGEGTLGALLNDPSFADHLRTSLVHLQTATAGSEKMIANLEDFSSRLKQPDGLANQLITDTIVFHHLKAAVTRLDSAASAAAAFSASLQTAGQGLNDPHSPIGLMLHDEESADNLQRTIKNLRVSSKELSDDLEAVQHSFLLRGFFKKKKKDGTE
jgi:phospholipid/cholesterol/gamma-HCH transport system substrate-binding protein